MAFSLQPTLEDYLLASINVGAIDHAIRASVSNDGEVIFYIHPDRKCGNTLDFIVKGNTLMPRFMVAI